MGTLGVLDQLCNQGRKCLHATRMGALLSERRTAEKCAGLGLMSFKNNLRPQPVFEDDNYLVEFRVEWTMHQYDHITGDCAVVRSNGVTCRVGAIGGGRDHWYRRAQEWPCSLDETVCNLDRQLILDTALNLACDDVREPGYDDIRRGSM